MDTYQVDFKNDSEKYIFINMAEKRTYLKQRFIGQGTYEYSADYGTTFGIFLRNDQIIMAFFAGSSHEMNRNCRLRWTLNPSNQWILDKHCNLSDFHTTIRQLPSWYIGQLFCYLQLAIKEHPEILEIEPRLTYIPKEFKDITEFENYDDEKYLSTKYLIEHERWNALVNAFRHVNLGIPTSVVMPITGSKYKIEAVNPDSNLIVYHATQE